MDRGQAGRRGQAEEHARVRGEFRDELHWGPQGEAWLRLRTAHFELHTDVREPEALDFARALEEARASLLTLGWKGAPDPPGRTEVTVFAREELFREYVQHEQVAGLAGTEHLPPAGGALRACFALALSRLRRRGLLAGREELIDAHFGFVN
jgi:hypothetical protein